MPCAMISLLTGRRSDYGMGQKTYVLLTSLEESYINIRLKVGTKGEKIIYILKIYDIII